MNRLLLRIRAFVALWSLSVRADPWRAALGFTPFVALSGGAAYVAARSLVDAGSKGNRPAAVGAVAVFAAAWLLAVTFARAGNSVRVRLVELTRVEFERRLMAAVSAVPEIDRLEEPGVQDHLELLRSRLFDIQNAPRMIGWLVDGGGGLVVSMVLIASVDVKLLVVAAAGLPAVWINAHSQRRVEQVRQQEAPRSRRALHFFDLATTTAPAKELRVSCLQDEVRARFDKDWRDSDRAMLRVESWAAVQQFLGAALSVAIFGVALVVLYRGVVDGQVKAGGIFLVLGVMTLVIGQLGGASDGVGSFGRTARVIEHLLFLEDLGRESRVKDRHSAPDSLGEGVTLENVSFRYHGSANDALSGVSLTLSAGSVVALVGENGAGKSTLVKLLFGLYRPTGGNVLVDGVPLESIEPVAWRSHTAACFQDFARLELSVRDSVGCGDLARPDDGSIVRALERADATGLVNRLDDGLDAVVGATLGGRELSGGEWQKLAIARGMVRPTPLLLALDEPTSALDPLTEERLFDQYAIRARSTDTSCDAVTIVVSHRFSTVRMADVIVVLDNGRVVEVGAHSELINRSGKYAELYRLQAQYYR